MQMSEGRYNIPKKYRVDKGMPMEILSQRIGHDKCRQIFETEVESITWCFQIVDEDDATGVGQLIRHKGISVFEVKMKSRISTELMTEMFASLIPKRSIITYICNGELAMATYIPAEKNYAAKMCVTDYYAYDSERMIEILDYERDFDKKVEDIHKRIFAAVRQRKRIIMVEKAFETIQKDSKKVSDELEEAFRVENLDKIRQDAAFVQEQLRVESSH